MVLFKHSLGAATRIMSCLSIDLFTVSEAFLQMMGCKPMHTNNIAEPCNLLLWLKKEKEDGKPEQSLP